MSDKKRDQIERGIKAKQLLDNQLLAEAFEQVGQDILSQWTYSKDPQEREQLWGQYHGLEAVKECLMHYAIMGKAAQKELERK